MGTPMKSRANRMILCLNRGISALACSNGKGSPAESQIPQAHDPK